MVKVDLITGFLGSGKTTFIKKYASHFISQGQRVGILENDYGAVNVDMMLLKELRGDNCELEMVAGACDSDCHARRFKTKLISMAMSGYDRVIIEPSGIFDVDEFFDVIRDEPLDKWYEIGNVIAIVDARLSANISDTASYYLASQVANAGAIVLSRTQLVSPAQIVSVKKQVIKACENVKLRRDISNIFIDTPWDESDFACFAKVSFRESSYVKLMTREETNFETLYFLDTPMDSSRVDAIMSSIFSGSYGDVMRVKGFYLEGDTWKQVNAIPGQCEIENIEDGQKVMIVIGENLNKERINKLFDN
ncbi:MAG: GTP-binding protein [Saccharofermentans sp.]|nr:GTP-binding protein [Saccharofermentans sp.]